MDGRSYLEVGLEALQNGEGERALGLLRRAAGADLGAPEPWYWMGHLRERASDPAGAAYCYYLALDIRRHAPSVEALQRLGYLARPHGHAPGPMIL